MMSQYLHQSKHITVGLFVRVELFFDSCEEMKAWIQEKDAVLSDGDLGRDLETVRALQRRHQVQELQPEGRGGGKTSATYIFPVIQCAKE